MSWKCGNRYDGPLLVLKEERKRELAGLQTAPGMEIAGQAAVPASPPGPSHDQLHTAGGWSDQASKQMAHFGNRQREQGSGIGGLCWLLGTSVRKTGRFLRTVMPSSQHRRWRACANPQAVLLVHYSRT